MDKDNATHSAQPAQQAMWNTDAAKIDRDAIDIFHVDVSGYEGPLDLLLTLARDQKVDLNNISILALAEQYLIFIEEARKRRIEIAADYLVMAAWLAYLKSRLMLPADETEEETSGEELAAMLQFRLLRLEAMRDAAAKLMNANRLGRDRFVRGDPEPITIDRENIWTMSYYELLKAYATQRERNLPVEVVLEKRTVWSLQEARDILTKLIGQSMDWIPLQSYLADYLSDPAERRTALASSFSASLELVRIGTLEVSQSSAFGPLLMRAKIAQPDSGDEEISYARTGTQS